VNISLGECSANLPQFYHKEESLSIIESIGSGDSSDPGLCTLPYSLYFLRSLHPLEFFSPETSGPPPAGAQAKDSEPPEEWGLYIERSWAPWTRKFFSVCLIAGMCRLFAFTLQHSGVINDAVFCSILLTFSVVYLIVIIPNFATRCTHENFWFTLAWARIFDYFLSVGKNALYYQSFRDPLELSRVLSARALAAVGASFFAGLLFTVYGDPMAFATGVNVLLEDDRKVIFDMVMRLVILSGSSKTQHLMTTTVQHSIVYTLLLILAASVIETSKVLITRSIQLGLECQLILSLAYGIALWWIVFIPRGRIYWDPKMQYFLEEFPKLMG
jgi:hypothetical protein